LFVVKRQTHGNRAPLMAKPAALSLETTGAQHPSEKNWITLGRVTGEPHQNWVAIADSRKNALNCDKWSEREGRAPTKPEGLQQRHHRRPDSFDTRN